MVTRLFRLLVSKNKWNSHCHEYWRRLSNFITCLAEPLDKIVILRLYTLNFQSWEGWTWARVILLFTRRGDKINDNLTTIILKKRKKGFHLLSSEDKNIDLATTAHQGANETQIILALSFCIQRRIEYDSKYRLEFTRI